MKKQASKTQGRKKVRLFSGRRRWPFSFLFLALRKNRHKPECGSSFPKAAENLYIRHLYSGNIKIYNYFAFTRLVAEVAELVDA